jgi:hypothetical protein
MRIMWLVILIVALVLPSIVRAESGCRYTWDCPNRMERVKSRLGDTYGTCIGAVKVGPRILVIEATALWVRANPNIPPRTAALHPASPSAINFFDPPHFLLDKRLTMSYNVIKQRADGPRNH